MHARLNRRFLDGSDGFVELRKPVVNVSYIPKDEGDISIGERGVPEFVLTYGDKIPGPAEEPELYSISHDPLRQPSGEYWLRFPLSTVIILTEAEDRKFRQENPDLIERVEALLVY